MPKSVRHSGVELLRIVSMLMVLAVHFDGASIGLAEPVSLSQTDGEWWWRTIVESLAIVGVNCFTLISGYFGIRASVKGLLMFVSTCVFYSVAIYCGNVAFGATFEPQKFAESFLAIIHTELWYVPAYLCLYLISPFINIVVEKIGLRRLTACTATFIAFNLYAGWWWHGSFNPTGYTVVQLIMMYFIGRTVSAWITTHPHFLRRSLRYGLLLYAVASVCTMLSAAYMPALQVYAYNSPLVVAASIGLLLAAIGLNFRSSTLNYISKSSFAVYLIHKNPAVWRNVVKPMSVATWAEGNLWLMTGAMLLFMLATFACAVCAEEFRRRICAPIIELLTIAIHKFERSLPI